METKNFNENMNNAIESVKNVVETAINGNLVEPAMIDKSSYSGDIYFSLGDNKELSVHISKNGATTVFMSYKNESTEAYERYNREYCSKKVAKKQAELEKVQAELDKAQEELEKAQAELDGMSND